MHVVIVQVENNYKYTKYSIDGEGDVEQKYSSSRSHNGTCTSTSDDHLGFWCSSLMETKYHSV